MTTLFISDLHLDDRRPETTALFFEFLQTQARHAETLYILGDLFEYWLGDDAAGACSEQVAAALSALAAAQVECYFMHGNRDFLLGADYARRAAITLLPQPHVIDLYGERVLLLHGDSLCTDDIAYQRFRKQVRNPAWQRDFLARPLRERSVLADEARAASDGYKQATAAEIMDVNQDAVEAEMSRHGVTRMIHGHTHRPAVHEFRSGNETARRFVLGDWYRQASVLSVRAGHYDLRP
ncbi:MAG: UDP-2,3-diacylglucosamine diphosphatase [Lysobacterales bacterium]|jgi:UDP-2,3-diacylglucosamine hydrolase